LAELAELTGRFYRDLVAAGLPPALAESCTQAWYAQALRLLMVGVVETDHGPIIVRHRS
jgi:hypothetical protein